MADAQHYYGDQPTYGPDGQPVWTDSSVHSNAESAMVAAVDPSLQQDWAGWQHGDGDQSGSQVHAPAGYHTDYGSLPDSGHGLGGFVQHPSSYPPASYMQQGGYPPADGSFGYAESDPALPPSLQTTPTGHHTQITPQAHNPRKLADAYASPTKKSTQSQASPRKTRRKTITDRSASVQPISQGRPRPRVKHSSSSNPLSSSSSASTISITRPATPSSRQASSPHKGPSSPTKHHQRYNPYKQFDEDVHPQLPPSAYFPAQAKVLNYDQPLPEAYPSLVNRQDGSNEQFHLMPASSSDIGPGLVSYSHLPPSTSATSPYGLYTPGFFPVVDAEYAGHPGALDNAHVFYQDAVAPSAFHPSVQQAGKVQASASDVPGVYNCPPSHLTAGFAMLAPDHPIVAHTRNLHARLAEVPRFQLTQSPGNKHAKSTAKRPGLPSPIKDVSAVVRAIRGLPQPVTSGPVKSDPSSNESEDDGGQDWHKTDEEGGEGNDEEEGAQFEGDDGDDDFSENLEHCFPWVKKMVMNQQVTTNPDGTLRIPRSSNSYMIFRAWTGRQKVRDNLVLDEETKKSVVRLLEGKNDIARKRLKAATDDKVRGTWQNAIDQNDKRINNIRINQSNGMPQSCVSVVTSVLWSKTSKEVKKTFADLAKYAAELHTERFPGYKYQPEKKDAKKARLEAMKLAKRAAKESAKADLKTVRKPRSRKKGKQVVGDVAAPVDLGQSLGSAFYAHRTQQGAIDDSQWQQTLGNDPSQHVPGYVFADIADSGRLKTQRAGTNVSAVPMELQQHPQIRMQQAPAQATQPPFYVGPQNMYAPQGSDYDAAPAPTPWQSSWQDPSSRREDFQTIEVPLVPSESQQDSGTSSAENPAGHVELRLTSKAPENAGEGTIMDAVLVPAHFVEAGDGGDQAFPADLMGISQEDLAQLDLWALVEAENNAEILAGLPEGSGGQQAGEGEVDYAEVVVNDWAELVDTSEEAEYADYEISTGLADRILASYAQDYGAPLTGSPYTGSLAVPHSWANTQQLEPHGHSSQYAGVIDHSQGQAQDTLVAWAPNPITPLEGSFPDVFQHSLSAQQVNSLGHESSGVDSTRHNPGLSYGTSPSPLSPTYSTFGDLSGSTNRYVSTSSFPMGGMNPMDEYGDAEASMRRASTATQPRMISQMFDPEDMPPPVAEEAAAAPAAAPDVGPMYGGNARQMIAARRGRRGRALGQAHR